MWDWTDLNCVCLSKNYTRQKWKYWGKNQGLTQLATFKNKQKNKTGSLSVVQYYTRDFFFEGFSPRPDCWMRIVNRNGWDHINVNAWLECDAWNEYVQQGRGVRQGRSLHPCRGDPGLVRGRGGELKIAKQWRQSKRTSSIEFRKPQLNRSMKNWCPVNLNSWRVQDDRDGAVEPN